MLINKIIMWMAAIGCLLGGLDRISGNRFGLGRNFEEGLITMGPLALGMGGLICLAPVIANFIGPAISPFFKVIGCDPAIFGAILPNDTGGYPLAMGLAASTEAGLYAGLIVAAMFGATLTFYIPVGFAMIDRKDSPYYAQGILIGMIAVPFGSVIGGFVAGFSAKTVLMNIIPITVLVVLICIGLKCIPTAMIKGCEIFGKIIMVLCTVGLACAGFESLTGTAIIPGMTGIGDSLAVVAQIGVVLMGMVPVIHLLIKLLDRPLSKLGKKIGINTASSSGLLVAAVNPFPVYNLYKDMDSRGKVINGAFLVCAGTFLGDHLGFTASVAPEYIFPVIAGKVCGGLLTLVLAFLMTGSKSTCNGRGRETVESAKKQR